MPITQDEAKNRITKLVARYQALTPAQIKQYNEENTKKDFVMPLFEALGWEVYDSQEVAAEEKASGGRVDYAFKLQGVARFLVEAKPLRADLNRDDYIKQVVTYAYNKGITWAVLTDFEGLRLFNAQTGHSCINLSSQNYLSNFDDLWRLSRESVENKALEGWAQKYGHMPPPLPVEQRLFRQLRDWREVLSQQIHLYPQNASITPEQVDEVILRFFNRLIFIRTAEDRRLEEYPLRAALNQWLTRKRSGELIEELRRIFRDFEDYYDSELFSPHLVDQVFVDGSTLEDILQGLYQPPALMAGYDFSVIDADVLGAVYEQYLGQITVIVKQRAKAAQTRMDLGLPQDVAYETEANKQRRKEMGIYYTPKWVTEYIVAQTVGRFLKEKSHNEILNMRILDPACGSGSFLIKAYDALLNYHAEARSKSAAELDQFDRLPILTGNIFGVDLDQQAVEIARLNLLIRSLAKRDILPPLSDNVKQGNSLISGSEADLKPFFGHVFQAKRPFNWEQEFKEIVSKGGFDVVIGNPPYVRIQSLPREEADYFRQKYQSAYGSFDIYVLFIEKTLQLLKHGGCLGFICSSKFLKSQYGKKIQELLQRDCTVEEIVDLSAMKVFADATTYPAILVVRKGVSEGSLRYVSVPEDLEDSISAAELNKLPAILSNQESVTKGMWPPPPAAGDPLLEKLAAKSQPLSELAERIFVGLQTSADNVYILEKRGKPEKGLVRVFSRATSKFYQLETELLHPLLKGSLHMRRYYFDPTNLLVLFPYREKDGSFELMPDTMLERKCPLTWQYLIDNRQALEDRESGKMRHSGWYAYVYPKNLQFLGKPKIVVPSLGKRASFSFDAKGEFYFVGSGGGGGGGYGITLKPEAKVSPLFVLGLLNSKTVDFYLHQISSPFRGGYRAYNRQYLEPLPIRHINFRKPADKKLHDDLVTLVERMLELQQRLVPLRDTPCVERDQLQHQIELTDREVDNLVYDLYGLTDSERKTMEDSFRQ